MNPGPRYCDVHAHPTDPRLAMEAVAVVRQAAEHGVAWLLATATRPLDWPAVLALVAEPETIAWGALGVHPYFAADWSSAAELALAGHLRQSGRLLAVGEIGLDFWIGREQADRQLAVLEAQLAVARRLDLPVVCHNRKSWNEFFAAVRQVGLGPRGGVCHAFAGSREVARQALDAGFHLSFAGTVADPRHQRARDAARYVPLDRLLSETDTPDLPTPKHAGGRSRPEHVVEVVAALADLRGLSPATVAAAIAANVAKLFSRGSDFLIRGYCHCSQ